MMQLCTIALYDATKNLFFSAFRCFGYRLCRQMATKRPAVVFVLGPPGAGKGTQCERIVKHYGYTHLSAGELLRQEQKRSGSKYGEIIDGHIRNGTIVPVEITLSLLHQAMLDSDNDKFLVDGFPRNQNNLDGWIEHMTGKVDVKFVLFLDCSVELCVERCLGRGESSGRTDDNIESLRKRIDTYNNSTLAIIKYYMTSNLVKTIDASQSVDDTWSTVSKCFDQCAAACSSAQS